MKKIQWKPLLISLLLSLGAGALSSALAPGSKRIYSLIYHPPLAPPGWVFPVVWTALYLLMAIAAYLIYISDSPDSKRALKWYGAQLLVNAGWSVIFFRFHACLMAFAWLLLLWYLVYQTIRQFYTVNRTAGKLMIPYLVWISFAAYLNLAIVIHYAFLG